MDGEPHIPIPIRLHAQASVRSIFHVTLFSWINSKTLILNQSLNPMQLEESRKTYGPHVVSPFTIKIMIFDFFNIWLLVHFIQTWHLNATMMHF